MPNYNPGGTVGSASQGGIERLAKARNANPSGFALDDVGGALGKIGGGFLGGFLGGGGMPGFSSSSSAESTALSSATGYFQTGDFNPVFGGESAPQTLARSVPTLGALVLGGVAVWLIARS
jgi:hypothetical protein